MPDINTGNFINPDYATPEQAAQLRAYANALQGGSIQPTAKSGSGVIANALMGFLGQTKTDQANQLTRQLAQQSTNELNNNTNPLVSALIHGLPQGGQQPQPMSYAPPQAPMPAAPQGQPAMMPQQQGAMGPADVPTGIPMPPGQNITGPNTRVTGVDYGPVTGNPSFSGSSPSGAGAPNGQALMAQNGSLAPILSSPSIPAEVKAQILQGGMPKGGMDVYGHPTVGTTMGGVRATDVGPGVSTGARFPVSVQTPGASVSTEYIQPGPNAQGGGIQGAIQPAMDAARSVGLQGAGNKAVQDQATADISTAANAPNIRQTLATMRDDIVSHGDKMVWGPTAPWLNDLKRGIAQHAPGLMSESDMAGLASADSFDKLTAQLQSIVGRQVGGTDASLMQGMKSVPGSHNSKQGALALIDMLDQAARQNAQFIQQNQYQLGQPGFNYLAAKNQFFDQHPIVNPITGHPLRMDLSGKGGGSAPVPAAGGWGIKR